MKSGLFLDLDGTLADSLGVMRAVYNNFLTHHGQEGSAAEFNILNGPPLAEGIAYLKNKYDIGTDLPSLTTKYWEMVDAEYMNVLPMPGAEKLITAAKNSGKTVAIVTSGTKKRTDDWLSRVGLRSNIDFIISCEDTKQGKPSPDPYLKALSQGSCTPEKSIALEDSKNGLEAASAAHLQTFCYRPNKDTDNMSVPPNVKTIYNLEDLISYF